MSFQNWVNRRKEPRKDEEARFVDRAVEVDRGLREHFDPTGTKTAVRSFIFFFSIIATGILLFWLVSSR